MKRIPRTKILVSLRDMTLGWIQEVCLAKKEEKWNTTSFINKILIFLSGLSKESIIIAADTNSLRVLKNFEETLNLDKNTESYTGAFVIELIYDERGISIVSERRVSNEVNFSNREKPKEAQIYSSKPTKPIDFSEDIEGIDFSEIEPIDAFSYKAE